MVTQQFIFGVENPQTKLDFPLGPAEAQPSKGIRKLFQGLYMLTWCYFPVSYIPICFPILRAYSILFMLIPVNLDCQGPAASMQLDIGPGPV